MSVRNGMDDARSVVSVGQAVSGTSVYSTNHPAYKFLADQVSAEVLKVSEREATRRSAAKPVLMPYNIDTAVSEVIRKDYPELEVQSFSISTPGHIEYNAMQYMANELIANHVHEMSPSVIHIAGNLMAHLTRESRDVHFEYDPTSAVGVHKRHNDTAFVARVMSSYAQVVDATRSQHVRGNYESYLTRKSYGSCMDGSSCAHKAQGVCADLSMVSMSPAQLAAGMLQCGAEYCEGFIPYHPSMLIRDEGEIPGTRISFKKTSDSLILKYPEGVSGVERYPLHYWAGFLTQHCVSVGKGASRADYHMELMKPRGPFMFFRMVRVPTVEAYGTIRHALELPHEQPMYCITAWRLRNLAADQFMPSSWESFGFFTPVKLFDALIEFGMQLEPEKFTRFAIRKQLKVYDRVTIEGSMVTVGYIPTREEGDALVSVVYAKLFVMRYESSKLTQAMMSRLRVVSGFSSASSVEKLRTVAMWVATAASDYLTGGVMDVLENLCQWIESTLPVGKRVRLPTVVRAPEFHLFESTRDSWLRTASAAVSDAAAVLTSFVGASPAPLRGQVIARAMTRTRRDTVMRAARVVSDVPTSASAAHHRVAVELDDAPTNVAPTLGDAARDALHDALVGDLRALNKFDQAPVDRHYMPTQRVVRDPEYGLASKSDFEEDVDFVGTLNRVYDVFNPGVAERELWRDIASLSHHDQDRYIVTEWMRIPRQHGSAPVNRKYYFSKLHALGAPKRQETVPELFSAVAARNLSAPKVSLPADYDALIEEVWDNFLKVACVDGAKELLASYMADPVSLEEDAYRDWVSKAKPDAVKRIAKEVEQDAKAIEEMPVNDYIMMLKADVKPPVSDKPLRARIEPQVIVYHDKLLSSMYSSMFRVLVRRFLSLLKPNIHVNLLKDTRDIGNFITQCHPFGAKLNYLENDFGKYDKSQDEFVFRLEEYIFRMLGMNELMLQRWVNGHVDCRLRSVTTGMSLHLRYQRKSGDATTAFGNVILNIVSTMFAYQPAQVAWAVYMGDDSILATFSGGYDDRAVQILAEVFNLSAKFYVTDFPYFASHFIQIDDVGRNVAMVPDPIKWIEKRSQPVPADDPTWQDRFVSAADSCAVYRSRLNTAALAAAVTGRHNVPIEYSVSLASAVATATATFENFRAMYDDEPKEIIY